MLHAHCGCSLRESLGPGEGRISSKVSEQVIEHMVVYSSLRDLFITYLEFVSTVILKHRHQTSASSFFPESRVNLVDTASIFVCGLDCPFCHMMSGVDTAKQQQPSLVAQACPARQVTDSSTLEHTSLQPFFFSLSC